MADRVVLDAHGVLAFLAEEQGWAEVEEILRAGEPWMTLVNLGEVAYILERASGAGAADEAWANLRAESRPGGAPVRWIDVDDTLVRRAAAIKAQGGSAMPTPSPPPPHRCSTARSLRVTRRSGWPRSSG